MNRHLCARFVVMLMLLGCHLAVAGTENEGQTSGQATVSLLVYKKWIGASGAEARVEIHLSCGRNDDFPPRFINRDHADGWQIEHVPAEGIFCSVSEIGRDTFVADTGDCRDLLVVPGQDVECTMVNTKVVKRIEMLNRYGLGLMIGVMLAAGLVAVRKFTPG